MASGAVPRTALVLVLLPSRRKLLYCMLVDKDPILTRPPTCAAESELVSFTCPRVCGNECDYRIGQAALVRTQVLRDTGTGTVVVANAASI